MRARVTIVLLHSPLVGSGSWAKVGALLHESRYDVVRPDLSPAFRTDSPFYPRLVARVSDTIAGVDHATLVVHSGAGALVPAILRANPQIEEVIFVDALLPHPGRDWFSTASPALAQHVRKISKGEHLPRWHEWWPRDAIRTLVGDDATYESFIAALPEVPIVYFEEIAPADEIPSGVRCAYLQLSAACKDDADEAEARGWTVRREALNHLAMLTHPIVVAGHLQQLANS